MCSSTEVELKWSFWLVGCSNTLYDIISCEFDSPSVRKFHTNKQSDTNSVTRESGVSEFGHVMRRSAPYSAGTWHISTSECFIYLHLRCPFFSFHLLSWWRNDSSPPVYRNYYTIQSWIVPQFQFQLRWRRSRSLAVLVIRAEAVCIYSRLIRLNDRLQEECVISAQHRDSGTFSFIVLWSWNGIKTQISHWGFDTSQESLTRLTLETPFINQLNKRLLTDQRYTRFLIPLCGAFAVQVPLNELLL